MFARTASAVHVPSIHLGATLAAAMHRASAHLRDLRGRRALAAELSGLSDRELADIGMTRAAVPAPSLGLPHALYR